MLFIFLCFDFKMVGQNPSDQEIQNMENEMELSGDDTMDYTGEHYRIFIFISSTT